MNLDSREQALTFELMEALSSSLDLSQVLPLAQGVMSRLIQADYVALCVSKPGRPTEYDWLVTEMPAAFFTHYPEMAAEDFVRDAVVRHPNVVLRDTEMLPRKELTRSLLYRRCKDLGMPLEHVMSVMLDVNEDWHGGLTLYRRDRRHDFSDRDRAVLQWLTPILARTVRRCRMFGTVATSSQILDALFDQGTAFVVLTPPCTEKMRTTCATQLLEKWFDPSDCGPLGFPKVLLEHLALLVGMQGAGFNVDTWVRWGSDENLKVTFVRLPDQGGTPQWALLFQEIPHSIPLPVDLRLRLTERQAEIVEYVLRNWDNRLIAQELGLTWWTVKTHVRNIFEKLGVESRADLMYQAAWRRKPV
ncbi:LuxR C-terminal-related transcriptional regulator [Archangium sp.]|uniref:LuxR C-terminal-related transcriptional regulator n=1 Tax=Archangium sp. TaxID=1872627 RepID=UPI00389AC1C4